MQSVDDFLRHLGLERSVRPMDLLEEQFYAYAAEELRKDKCSPGLMAKAFSEAEGDEKKADALYIKLRVIQLKAAFERVQRSPIEEDASKAEAVSEPIYIPSGAASSQRGEDLFMVFVGIAGLIVLALMIAIASQL